MQTTLEDLIKLIKTLNVLYAGASGTLSMDVHAMVEATKLFETANWQLISTGPLSGSRFFETDHGFVVQNPQPNNEFSLLEKNMAKNLGIVSTVA